MITHNGIGRNNRRTFYVSIQWTEPDDRERALAILFGCALAALATCDGGVTWEERPARTRGWYASVRIEPRDESLPNGGPMHRRIIAEAFRRADDQREKQLRRRNP